MNTEVLSANASKAASSGAQALRARWTAMSARERLYVGVGAALVGTVAVYVLAIRPAWQVVREAPTRIAELDVELQHMRRLAAETKELRGTPRTAPTQAAGALKSATDPLGSAGRLTIAGDRATLTLTQANSEQLRRWLIDARSAARVRTVEATLSRSPSGGYSGSIVVAMPPP